MSENKKNTIIKKAFKSSDVFYNNGIVNIYDVLAKLQNNKAYGIQNLQLKDNELIFNTNDVDENNLYYDLLGRFIKDNKIVYQTKNNRIYWSFEKNNFIVDKKFDVKGKSSGNDVKYLYKYKTAKELNYTTKELLDKFIKFSVKENLDNKLKNDFGKTFNSGTNLKKEEKINLTIHLDVNEAVENFSEYMAKGDVLTLDSKIHQFEDGGFCFKDMLDRKKGEISKWDALIYWYGVRIKRYYNSLYFIFVNSDNLNSLYLFKKRMKINDNPIEYSEGEGKPNKVIPTNINMMDVLAREGINVNKNFYISKSMEEFKLKLFMYLFSYIHHIEQDYARLTNSRFSKRLPPHMQKNEALKKIFLCLEDISFLTYEEDGGNMKTNLNEYTKAYKLFSFFYSCKKTESENLYLFRTLADIISTISLSKSSKEVNLNIKSFCENILNFRTARQNYFLAVFDSLKNNSKSFGYGLFAFEDNYLKFIERSNEEMGLHENSKELGNVIGRFCKETNDKNLLFKLRNIKNHNQLVSYFKDFEFSTLKVSNQEKKITPIAKRYHDNLEETFENLEQKKSDWEIIRDYVAIYAINMFRYLYWKENNEKGGRK